MKGKNYEERVNQTMDSYSSGNPEPVQDFEFEFKPLEYKPQTSDIDNPPKTKSIKEEEE